MLKFVNVTTPYKHIKGGNQEKKIDKIRQFPDKGERHDAADKNHYNIKIVVQGGSFSVKQKIKALSAKEAPAHECGKSKTDNGSRQYFITKEGKLGKGGSSQRAGG